MKGLTSRQCEILRFIRDYTDANFFPPSLREIADHFEISAVTIQEHVSALLKKGFLAQSEGKSRSLRVLIDPDAISDDSAAFIEIPVFGDVAAGMPISTFEESDETIFLPQNMFKRSASFFAFTVRGDSMVDAGIFDGDMAIVEKTETAQNGEIVVAVLDDKITLKRFFREANRVRLEAENQKYSPIFCTNVRVAGRLSKIIRKY